MKVFGKAILILICFYFTYQLLFTPGMWIFLDGINMVIHEAGHLLFIPFGEFLHVLAGSVFEILFPCLFFGYFLMKKDYFSTSFSLFWIADNFIYLSLYMKDSVAMVTPKLGGEGSIHDWNYLFTAWHILPESQIIGQSVFIVGVTLLFLGLIGMIFFTIKESLYSKSSNFN